jgi:two-component system response regulator NreC
MHKAAKHVGPARREPERRPEPLRDRSERKPEPGAVNKIRVLICDDHTLFREGIRAILSTDPSLEIVGEAEDGRKAVQEALRIRPEVILMDVSMPALIGYEAIREILRDLPRARILVLTMYEEEDIIRRCLRAGAAGYIVKDAPAAQLLEAVHSVHEGGQYLSPRVLKKVVSGYMEDSSPPETRYDTLSTREREVLKMLAEGYSVKEIASRLNLSVKTAEAHKYNLMRKLDLHDRTSLIKYALSKRLIAFPTVE